MKNQILNLALIAFFGMSLSLQAQTWTTNGSSAICKTNGNNVRITVKSNGSVWIGDSTGTQKSTNTLLFVDGTTKVREIIINMANWPDYVFDSCYYLMPIDSISVYVDSTGHLPNVPSKKKLSQMEFLWGK